MHSSTTLAVILLAASAASPALAAPLSTNQAREFDELMAREPSLLSILKPLGTGLLGGGAVAALDHFIGGGDSSSSSKRSIEAREYDELVARSIVGSLLGATEDSLGTVLKTAAAGGLASGAVGAVGSEVEKLFGHKDSSSKRFGLELGTEGVVQSSPTLLELLGNKGQITAPAPASRRQLEERLDLGPIEKGLIGTVTGLGVSSAASGLLGKLFGNSDSSSRRGIIEDSPHVGTLSLPDFLEATGRVPQTGVPAPASRRELDERLNLGPIEKGILGTVTGLGVSSAASGILGKLFGNSDSSSSRRDVTPEQVLAAVLLSGRSFNELD
ncbi:hypothetical protein FA95DRAFT_1610594 [Auriscalpium vulgare]|uniref:Uncharacterized protein n=1 Tax=Auriscalpium vulgare TaxID=40419 RepID=A0ACB8RCX1_9AGAM|nr:hypothetical protein FA95DRAFT_1610594 [Auriscalpium vulgare]